MEKSSYQAGTPSWVDIGVADMDAAMAFYANVLGFEPTYTMAGPDGRTAHGSMKRGEVALMFALPYGDDPHDQPPYGNGVALYTTIAEDEDCLQILARQLCRERQARRP